MTEILPTDQHTMIPASELPAELQNLPFQAAQRILLVQTLRRQNTNEQLARCRAYLEQHPTDESSDTV